MLARFRRVLVALLQCGAVAGNDVARSRFVLGRVAVSSGPALRPKIASAKAQGAGRSHSAVKPCNAGWRDFGLQPFGPGAILPQYGVAARSWCMLHDAYCALSCDKMAAGAASGQTSTRASPTYATYTTQGLGQPRRETTRLLRWMNSGSPP